MTHRHGQKHEQKPLPKQEPRTDRMGAPGDELGRGGVKDPNEKLRQNASPSQPSKKESDTSNPDADAAGMTRPPADS